MSKGKHVAKKTGLFSKESKAPVISSGKHGAKKKTPKVLKTLLIILAVLVVICLAAVIFVRRFAKAKIEKMNYVPTEISEETQEPKITILESIPVQTVVNEETGEETTESTLVEEEVELPEGEVVEDQKVLNILLVGTDFRSKDWDDPGRADVTMLCSINKKEGTVKLISFERGIMVPIPGKGSDLLTHSYVWGGMNLLIQDLQDCFLLNIDGYMHVDFDTFKEVVNALGGVDIELTSEEVKALLKRGVSVDLHTGMNHLDGYTALKYCRLRKIDTNFGRIERQRKTVQAMFDKAKGMSLSEINDMANKVLPYIETNIPEETFLSLLDAAPKFIGVVAEQYQVPEGNDSSKIDLNYEADRLKTIIYGE